MKPIAAILVLLSTISGAAQTPVGVPVFVTSAGAANGLSDPNKDNQDSVKDLRNSLKGKKGLTLVESAEDATLVLTVHNRGRSQYTASVFGPGRDVSLNVTLTYKGNESLLSATALGGTGITGGAWKKAAGKIAEQVETWAKTNREALAK